MINTIRVITIKTISKHISQDQRNSLTLSKGFAFKIDKEFFKTFSEEKVPYIHLRTTSDFLKHMAIDPKNQSFIRYDEVPGSNHTWKINYDEASSLCKLISVNKQNQNLCNIFVCFKPFWSDCIINDNLEILPLGSINVEES